MKVNRTARWIVLGAALLFVLGCAEKETPLVRPVQPTAETAEEARARLEAGEKAFQEGRLSEADRLLTDFLRRFPNQPGQDLAWLRHGQIQLQSGFPQGARKSLTTVLEGYPDSPHVREARISLAGALISLNQPQAGLSALAALDRKSLKPRELVHYQHQMARVRFELNQPKACLVALVSAYRSATAQERLKLASQLETFAAAWSEPVLQSLTKLYRSTFPAAWLLEAQVKKAANRSDWTRAKALQAELTRRFPDHVSGQITAPAEAQPAQTSAEPERFWTIGCLLPLSGPLAEYGQRLLQGIQLATGAFEADSAFSLLIEDTANDPLVTAAAVGKVAAGQETMAVIGPLSGRLALAAAQRAAEVEVPLVTLTQNPQASAESKWAFRDFFTPSVLIEALVERAVKDLGLTRLAVLHPESHYGRRMTELFTTQVERHGGLVVKVMPFQPDAPDLAQEMLALGGQESDAPPREAPLSFEALFLPDDYKIVAQVAPQLAFYDLTGLTLLGTNLWHDQALIDMAGPYVQGAIIPTVFFADSQEPQVQEFVRQFRANYGRQPDLFAALGYDAAKLVVDILSTGTVTSRQELRQGLIKTSGYPGVTGLTTFNEQGEALKKPFLITVKGDKFVEAPTEPRPKPEYGAIE